MKNKHRKTTQIFDLMDQMMSEQLGYLFGESVKTEDYIRWVETRLSNQEVDDMSSLIISPEEFDKVKKDKVKIMLRKKWEEFKTTK